MPESEFGPVTHGHHPPPPPASVRRTDAKSDTSPEPSNDDRSSANPVVCQASVHRSNERSFDQAPGRSALGASKEISSATTRCRSDTVRGGWFECPSAAGAAPSLAERRDEGYPGVYVERRVRGPARKTCDGNSRPTMRSACAATSMSASRSMPVATPMSSTM